MLLSRITLTLPVSICSVANADAIEGPQRLITRCDDAYAVRKTCQHLDLLGIAPPEAYRAPNCLASGAGHDENPCAAGVLIVRPVGHQQAAVRGTDREPHLQCLTATQRLRRCVRKQQIHLELALAHQTRRASW